MYLRESNLEISYNIENDEKQKTLNIKNQKITPIIQIYCSTKTGKQNYSFETFRQRIDRQYFRINL